MPVVESASANHFLSKGINLHIFLKLNCRASNRHMVVWEKTFPYSVPNARPTSAWVKPNLIRLCLNCLAKDSRSSEKQASEKTLGSLSSLGLQQQSYKHYLSTAKHRTLRFTKSLDDNQFKFIARYLKTRAKQSEAKKVRLKFLQNQLHHLT